MNLKDEHVPYSDAVTFSNEFAFTRYCVCAGCALVWWDWLITFEDEVTHIWPTKWTSTKIIFLFNRYLNLVLQPAVAVHLGGLSTTNSPMICRFYVVAYASIVFLSLASIHALVVVRAWVVWGQRPWITAVLVSAYLAYAMTCVPMMVYSFSTGDGKYIFNVDGICITHVHSRSIIMWIISLGLEYACFGLVIGNIWLHRRGTEPAFRQLSPIRKKICIAAVLFVLYTTFNHIVNIFLWTKYEKRPHNMIAVTFMYCLTNVAGQ
ncbi:hypothetical protein FPV67DRAFT_1715244 [Lyophyllum atratum]|nr:hypothetical protein FPV67DRAFT_1715244 [Lyophyllum atratum]